MQEKSRKNARKMNFLTKIGIFAIITSIFVVSLCIPLLLHAYIMRKYACYIPIIM